jgi:2-methylisocitrate lyase-like PEP mutase family enzyme
MSHRLRDLHHGEQPLVLANVWDPGTARIVAGMGFSAVATSSAAVAEAQGYADHEEMPADIAFAAVAAIAAAVEVPVTADMESGYGLAPTEFAERLLATGAVGCNYEDSDHTRPGTQRPADEQAARLAAVRAAAGEALVINARVDTFLLQTGGVDDAVARARLYLEAGADCVYPITLSDDAVIAAVVEQVPGPVNILLWPAAPPLARLVELGVRRISVGSGLYRQAMKAFTTGLDALRTDSSS